MFPCNAPTLETVDEIERKQQLTNEDFIDLQTKFDQLNDVATKQKKEKKLDDLIDSVTDNNNSFSTFDNFWWEDEMFSDRDYQKLLKPLKIIQVKLMKCQTKFLEALDLLTIGQQIN